MKVETDQFEVKVIRTAKVEHEGHVLEVDSDNELVFDDNCLYITPDKIDLLCSMLRAYKGAIREERNYDVE